MPTRTGLVWLLLVVIVAQIAVPTIALFQQRPARFGFQMYSGFDGGSIAVLDESGEEVEADLVALLPRPLRPELDWTQYIPEFFCATVPNAETIVIEQHISGSSSVPCN